MSKFILGIFLFSVSLAKADIGLIKPDNSVSVVYLENGMVYYKECRDGLSTDLDRDCEAKENSKGWSVPADKYYRNLAMLYKVHREEAEPDGFRKISQRIELLAQGIETDDYSGEERENALKRLEFFKSIQQRLTVFNRRIWSKIGKGANTRFDSSFQDDFFRVLDAQSPVWYDNIDKVWRIGSAVNGREVNAGVGCGARLQSPWRVAMEEDFRRVVEGKSVRNWMVGQEMFGNRQFWCPPYNYEANGSDWTFHLMLTEVTYHPDSKGDHIANRNVGSADGDPVLCVQ